MLMYTGSLLLAISGSKVMGTGTSPHARSQLQAEERKKERKKELVK